MLSIQSWIEQIQLIDHVRGTGLGTWGTMQIPPFLEEIMVWLLPHSQVQQLA